MIPSSSRSPAPGGRVWLLGVLAVIAALVLGVWLWLAEETAHVVPSPLAPVQAAESTLDVELAPHDSADSKSAASDAIGAEAGTGRKHVTGANASKPWAGGVIRGRVLGGPGASEPMSVIGVRATSPRSSVPIPERRAMTDAQGWFEMRDLVAAEWELASFLPPLDLRGAAVARIDEEHPFAEVEILLPFPRRVQVVIVDPSGRPASAESLGLDPAFLPFLGIGPGHDCHPIGSTIATADMPRHRGLDRSAKGERNTWELVIQSGGVGCVHALFGDRVIAARRLGATDERVEIVLDAAQIAANLGPCAVQVVAAENGTPVTSGYVRFQMAAGVNVSLALDKEGRAAVARCPLGTVELTISAPGYSPRGATLSLPADASTRYELVRGRRATGTVALDSGRDPRGFRPAAWRIVESTARLVGNRLQATQYDPTGNFAFDALDPGFYVIAAVPESVVSFTAEDVQAGKAGGAVYVDLRHADVHGLVLSVPAWLR